MPMNVATVPALGILVLRSRVAKRLSMKDLQSFLADHDGEYVKLIGVDPNAKRRISEVVIQQPNGKSKPAQSSSNS
jgi:ribulose bisphosphate carboxylase small subunit